MTKKILIAEDNQDILLILDMILNDAGYTVEPLPDGKGIVDRKNDWPDLFILDKELPYIDGLALCKYLRVNEATRDIPIIMISAYHKLRPKAEQAGVNDFIEKPFDVKTLLQKIEKYIHRDENGPVLVKSVIH